MRSCTARGRAIVFLFSAVVLCSAATAWAQPQLPDTPAGRQFSAWLQVWDGSSRDAYRDFLTSHFPTHLQMLDRDWDFRQRTGGFDLKKIEESSPTRLVALVQDRATDTIGRLTMEVDATEPHAITSVEVRAIPRPTDLPLPHLSEPDLIAAARDRAEKEAAAGRFSGAVLVAHDGKPVFAQAYGMADREHNIPNTLDTKFRIGSMNKMFTAVAILQLVEQGKVALTDPLGKYLPDYPNKDVASKVTIHDLLTHTGGTGDIFGPEFDAHRQDLKTLDDYVKLYGNRPLRFEPGSRWEYSNYGFILLGVVIEKASGESYYDYVQEHIFKPADMTQTGSEPEEAVVPRRSVGYTATGATDAMRPNTDTLPYRGSSAGGGYSTVGDLLRFANALEDHKLLNAHSLELLTTGKVDVPSGRYAYGMADESINGTRCFGHRGGAAGMNGELEVCPGPGYAVTVLANMDPPAAERIESFIADRLPAQ
jgi:D-alanyl-D-alanine carboxypeptidase